MDVFSVHGDSMEELNITGCDVEEIESNTFRGLDKLRMLNLVNNKIRKLDSLWIQDLTNLKALIVWRNWIAGVKARLYDLLPELSGALGHRAQRDESLSAYRVAEEVDETEKNLSR